VAQELLRKANEAKDEFLGLVSHELRTPITTIYGGARVLRSRSGHLTDESRSEILRDIESETERLHRLVEDLLVLARLQLGQEIEREPVLIQRVIDRVVRSYSQRSNRRVEVDVGNLEAVSGDATYLEQVLRNLITNAEKYSVSESPMTIRARANGGEAIVSVLDRGTGVAEGEEDTIFERFYRSKSSSRGTRGLGLGLTVCKRLIEAQGGRIWAAHRDGGGLEVSFMLPIHQEEPHGN
jgi:signal transduction histidine kinase